MASRNRKTVVAGALVVGALVAGAGAYLIREKVSEQPSFTVTESEGDFEIRDYGPMLVAETRVEGKREDALNRGFEILADYIFAKSRGGASVPAVGSAQPGSPAGEKIAMTAPVLNDKTAGNEWRTRFMMPSKYKRSTLPPPPERVSITELRGRRMAAVRFNGRATDETLKQHEHALRAWLADKKETASGHAEYAFYNSPFIPGPFRRNEVLIALD